MVRFRVKIRTREGLDLGSELGLWLGSVLGLHLHLFSNVPVSEICT